LSLSPIPLGYKSLNLHFENRHLCALESKALALEISPVHLENELNDYPFLLSPIPLGYKYSNRHSENPHLEELKDEHYQ